LTNDCPDDIIDSEDQEGKFFAKGIAQIADGLWRILRFCCIIITGEGDEL